MFNNNPFTTYGIDTDGDGFIDAYATTASYDMNGDLYADMTVTGIDYNMDGIIDAFLYSGDMDLDGIFETSAMELDTNGDGIMDYYAETRLIDTDGDLIPDTLVFSEDLNNDNYFDTVEVYSGDEIYTFFNQEAFSDYDQNEMYYQGNFGSATMNFNPHSQEIDYDSLVGTPHEDIQYWEFQGQSGPCAIYAQMFAYEGLTGRECDIDDLIEVAAENGWYDGSGTAMDDMDKVLEYLGVDTELSYDNDMDDIIETLENGGKVIVAVDGDEIWYGDNDDMFTPNSPNHAIEVIGVDYSSGEPMVILNDSGTPDGQGLMVPMDQFVDAWDDSGCLMVEAYL